MHSTELRMPGPLGPWACCDTEVWPFNPKNYYYYYYCSYFWVNQDEASRRWKIKERNDCHEEQWTGAETRMLSPWCPQWLLSSACQIPEPAQQPSGSMSQLFQWRLGRKGDCRRDDSTLRSCLQSALPATAPGLHAVSCKWDSAYALWTVISHAKGLPLANGSSMAP